MKPSNLELLLGGAAAIALIGLGVVLIAEATESPTEDGETSDLEDTSALASVATVL
jgi:hypothetical protein